MLYRYLGSSGVRISSLALGTANFGSLTDEEEVFRILNEAIDAGINLIDTADSYNRENASARTENLLGRWFKDNPHRRRNVVLATKVYATVGDGPNDSGLSALHIRQACEDSLRRLSTDHIDLYQMHHIDRTTPWEEVWQAMDNLVREGKVIYVGSSNFASWQVAMAQSAALRRDCLGLVSEQSIYNLTNRAVELEVLPACRSLGLGFLAYSPLNSGALSGNELRNNAIKQQSSRRSMSKNDLKIKRLISQLERYEKFCRDIGQSNAHVALAWILHRSDVCAPIIGPRTVKQLHSCLNALDLRLSEENMRCLDEIWPGPGGEAPEAYAW